MLASSRNVIIAPPHPTRNPYTPDASADPPPVGYKYIYIYMIYMYIIHIKWFPGFGLSSPGVSDGAGSGHSADLESDNMRKDARIYQDIK